LVAEPETLIKVGKQDLLTDAETTAGGLARALADDSSLSDALSPVTAI
jgi:hypothetical protein